MDFDCTHVFIVGVLPFVSSSRQPLKLRAWPKACWHNHCQVCLLPGVGYMYCMSEHAGMRCGFLCTVVHFCAKACFRKVVHPVASRRRFSHSTLLHVFALCCLQNEPCLPECYGLRLFEQAQGCFTHLSTKPCLQDCHCLPERRSLHSSFFSVCPQSCKP